MCGTGEPAEVEQRWINRTAVVEHGSIAPEPLADPVEERRRSRWLSWARWPNA